MNEAPTHNEPASLHILWMIPAPAFSQGAFPYKWTLCSEFFHMILSFFMITYLPVLF